MIDRDLSVDVLSSKDYGIWQVYANPLLLRPRIYVEEARLDSLEFVVQEFSKLDDRPPAARTTFQRAVSRSDFDQELEIKACSWVQEPGAFS